MNSQVEVTEIYRIGEKLIVFQLRLIEGTLLIGNEYKNDRLTFRITGIGTEHTPPGSDSYTALVVVDEDASSIDIYKGKKFTKRI